MRASATSLVSSARSTFNNRASRGSTATSGSVLPVRHAETAWRETPVASMIAAVLYGSRSAESPWRGVSSMADTVRHGWRHCQPWIAVSVPPVIQG